MSLSWRVVPIERWPGEQTRNRQDAPFFTIGPANEYGFRPRRGGVDWTATSDLLERELREMRAKNIVLQMAVTDRDIRNDGWIKAAARPTHPGVILSFESKHGPLSYPCDTYRDWQANVRAIALALEALRKVDRYGVTRRGEQYTGWKQLPGAGGTTTTMSAEVAARVMVECEGMDGDPETLLESIDAVLATFRQAAKRVHPDAGGTVETFQRLHLAKQILERHHGRANGASHQKP